MSWIPGVVSRNWKLKVASLSLAILLWTSLRVEAVDRQVLPSVPVRVQLNDPQWAVRSEPEPATVEVQFSGPANELLGLYLDRPTVTVPVDVVSAADTTVLLRSEWVRLQGRPGVTVEEIQPRQISLGFEPINQAVAPVALRTEGSLPGELALARSLSVTPEVVRISGPASQLEAVDSIPVVPLNLSDVESTGSRTLSVDTTGLYGLVISPGRVRVDYRVGEQVRRTLEAVRVVPPPEETGIEVEPDSTDVTLIGARSLVEAVESGSVWVEVPAGELAGLTAGQERTVGLEVRGVPELVRAELSVSEATARRVEVSSP
ncbi:MAG: YbbR-like domain-containing protein [Longimicrobiales bacterium]|nr:YbbR-like domain-containing protein [Longimicrobiales bacterium]